MISLVKKAVSQPADSFIPRRGKHQKSLKSGLLVALYNEEKRYEKELIGVIILNEPITNRKLRKFGLELLPTKYTQSRNSK